MRHGTSTRNVCSRAKSISLGKVIITILLFVFVLCLITSSADEVGSFSNQEFCEEDVHKNSHHLKYLMTLDNSPPELVMQVHKLLVFWTNLLTQVYCF